MLDRIDAEGFPRTDDWSPGEQIEPPERDLLAIQVPPAGVSPDLGAILDAAAAGEDLTEEDVVRLFQARGEDFGAVTRAADALRAAVNGDTVSFVVNRNINYTNMRIGRITARNGMVAKYDWLQERSWEVVRGVR